jgi:hypothetical protein
MITDPIGMCELLVGLPDVNVLAVEDTTPLRVHVELRSPSRRCPDCGAAGDWKERRRVELVDLAAFGRPVRLVWVKHRWMCRNEGCGRGSWTGQNRRVAAPRSGMTDRAGRWATEQVGRNGRTVSEVARELGCDWHTVNDTVLAYGQALLDADADRVGPMTALGLDETLYAKFGRWRTQGWATSIVDVTAGTLLDMTEGRDSQGSIRWIEARRCDVVSPEASAEVPRSGGVRDQLRAEGVHVGAVVAQPLDVLQPGAATQHVVGQVQHVV